MNKSIKLSGLSTNPSDYSCSDGNLSAALNVFHEMDSIIPVQNTAPKLIANIGDNMIMFRHENSDYKHVIIKTKTNNYFWKNEDEISSSYDLDPDVTHNIKISPKFTLTNATTGATLQLNDGDCINDGNAFIADNTIYNISVDTGLTIDGDDPFKDPKFSVISESFFKNTDRLGSFYFNTKYVFGGTYKYIYTFKYYDTLYTIAIAFGVLTDVVTVYISERATRYTSTSSDTPTVQNSTEVRTSAEETDGEQNDSSVSTYSTTTTTPANPTEYEQQLLDQISSQQTTINNQKTQITNLKTQVNSLNSTNQTLQTANTELSAKVSDLETSNRELQTAVTLPFLVSATNTNLNGTTIYVSNGYDGTMTYRKYKNADGTTPSIITDHTITGDHVTIGKGEYIFKCEGTNIEEKYTIKVSSTTHTFTTPEEKTTEYPYTDGGYPSTGIDVVIETKDPYLLAGLSGKTIKSISSLGHFLLVHTTDLNTYYFKFNIAEQNYHSLGNKMPELKISFGLESETKSFFTGDDIYTCNIATTTYGYDTAVLANLARLKFDHYKEKMRESTTAILNKFVSEECHEKGLFAMPFLVRYGYRLYDETVTMLSAPVLMTPSDIAPIISVDYVNFTKQIQEGNITQNNAFILDFYYKCHLVATRSALNYKVLNPEVVESIEGEWNGLIKGVEIFISSPFYMYEQDMVVSGVRRNGIPAINVSSAGYYSISGYSVDVDNDTTEWNEEKSKYHYGLKREFSDTEKNNYSVQGEVGYSADPIFPVLSYRNTNILGLRNQGSDAYGKVAHYACQGPILEYGKNAGDYAPVLSIDYECKSNEAYENEIKNCSLFYLAKSLSLGEVLTNGTNRTEINFKQGYLNALVTKEQLEDDYFSHDEIVADGITTYNDRMNLYGIHRKYYEGFDPETMFQHFDKNGTSSQNVKCDYIVKIDCQYGEIYFKHKDHVLGKCTSAEDYYRYLPKYFYFPNDYAKEVYMKVSIGSYNYYYKSLLYENFMTNGVSTVLGMSVKKSDTTGANWITITEQEYSAMNEKVAPQAFDVYEASTIMTSENANPFIYKAVNVETVGNGKVIALVPQTIAMSQGQFGQFPMICFTTDGIWSLSVNNTGGWSAKQPFSRDVVLNENAGNILQLDRQIMFATDRGLMMISGSEVNCISEVFDGMKDDLVVRYSTSSNENLNSFLRSKILNNTDLFTRRTDVTGYDAVYDFKTFISNAVFLYDYSHQRIIIGNPSYAFAYVYNIKDRLWSCLSQRITRAINSYPNCKTMTKIGTGSSENNLYVDFSASNGNAANVGLPSKGMILTRPLKLDDPDAMKTVTRVMARGKIDNADIKIVLLGSRNLKDWLIVGTSNSACLSLRHGTPFKYFRVALITDMAADESLTSLDIEYDIKLDNKIR